MDGHEELTNWIDFVPLLGTLFRSCPCVVCGDIKKRSAFKVLGPTKKIIPLLNRYRLRYALLSESEILLASCGNMDHFLVLQRLIDWTQFEWETSNITHPECKISAVVLEELQEKFRLRKAV